MIKLEFYSKRYILLSLICLIFLCSCTTTSRNPKLPFYRPSVTSDQEAISVYKASKSYKMVARTYRTSSGQVSISIFQKVIMCAGEYGTGDGTVVEFEVTIRNQSVRHTFKAFYLSGWNLIDSNGRVWNYRGSSDASYSHDYASIPDCVPGSEVRADIIFASGNYSSLYSLPSRLTLKIHGGFDPDSYNNEFSDDLIFDKIDSPW
jgi:hypothetical protein